MRCAISDKWWEITVTWLGVDFEAESWSRDITSPLCQLLVTLPRLQHWNIIHRLLQGHISDHHFSTWNFTLRFWCWNFTPCGLAEWRHQKVSKLSYLRFKTRNRRGILQWIQLSPFCFDHVTTHPCKPTISTTTCSISVRPPLNSYLNSVRDTMDVRKGRKDDNHMCPDKCWMSWKQVLCWLVIGWGLEGGGVEIRGSREMVLVMGVIVVNGLVWIWSV